METKGRSLKTDSKVSVRKDLFGAFDDKEVTEKVPISCTKSPLDVIWGESQSFSFTQPNSNSLLLSPSLKRSPNRFITSPSPKKSPGTPGRSASSPRKLSKYSPFRRKVYNPNPKNSIKKFFTVKEHSPKNEDQRCGNISIGIVRFNDPEPLNSTQMCGNIGNSQILSTNLEEFPQEASKSSVSLIENGTDETIMKNFETSSHTPRKNALPSTSKVSTPQSAKKSLSPTSKITGSKDLYGSFLLNLLLYAIAHDSDPEREKLFSDEEYGHINAFNKFDQPSQRLYARLLNRKIDWIRTSTMKYGDVHLQLMLLEQHGFILTDCSNESLQKLLNLLTLPDLKILCKSYKLSENGVKCDIISRLISRAKQPSIQSYFKKSSDDSSGDIHLRNKIYDLLGLVVKVASEPHRTFSRCLLLFSYPHFSGLERDRFSDQLALVSRRQEITFPCYEIIRTRVFHSRKHFLSYEAALLESSALIEAKEDKNWETALQRLKDIFNKLKIYLEDEEIRSEVEETPDFLRKFTPGGCYVRAVSSVLDLLRKSDHRLAESCIELLLGQRLFYRHRRGQWFEQLAMLYQLNLKNNIKACEAVLKGLRDEYIDLVSRHTLCARALMLEARKTNALKDYLKDTLATQRGLVEPLEDPPSVTITEQALSGGKTGLKKVYISDVQEGKLLSSVEEVVLAHFEGQGYKGCHDEGSTIKSIIYACFWNEIYGEYILDGHGMFHSEYQTVPLDWNSETFYNRRREKIKSKLQDLAEGEIEALISLFQDCYINNFGKECIVNWKWLENYESVQTLIRCLDIDFFLKMSRLLLRYHRTFKSGFPDLTLWNIKEKKCMFVEVKSPNDTLSMKQRVWLHNLNKMGATAIVCHVHSVGCKSNKRKASPTKDQ